jgi:hypothetical protein
MSDLRGMRLTPTCGPYRGLIGRLGAQRFDGMLVLDFPPGTCTIEGGAVARGVFDPRWVRRVG